MKAALLGILLLAVSASAQVLRPVDVRQRPDANDKSVAMPTVSFDTVPMPMRAQPVSPLTGKVRERAGTIETKQVDFETLTYATTPMTVLPQQNFTPKHGVVSLGGVRTSPSVQTGDAKIEKRVIRAFTPDGAEDLKKQLNEPH